MFVVLPIYFSLRLATPFTSLFCFKATRCRLMPSGDPGSGGIWRGGAGREGMGYIQKGVVGTQVVGCGGMFLVGCGVPTVVGVVWYCKCSSGCVLVS